MWDLIERYFVDCETSAEPPTVAGLAYALGYDSRAALQRDAGIVNGTGSGNARLLRRALLRIEAATEACLYATTNAGAKFALEHNHPGWSEPYGAGLPDEIIVELTGD